MSTDPRTANSPGASGGPVAAQATAAPVGSPVLGATVTIAHRRATDIRWGDTIAIPDEVFVPVPARVDGRRTWTWRGKPARLLANAHRWRWVYDVDQLDDEPGMGDSLPVGFRLLRISDYPDQAQEHRSLIVAVREVELIEVQVPAADEDRHQAPQQRATAAVAGGEPTRPVTAALDFEDFRARDAVLRVFDRSTEPGCDDASDMYVLDVFGVSVLVRLRTTRTHPASRPQLYVHIDNEGREPTHAAVEVCNGGETHYRI
jgi:hypothetical protein